MFMQKRTRREILLRLIRSAKPIKQTSSEVSPLLYMMRKMIIRGRHPRKMIRTVRVDAGAQSQTHNPIQKHTQREFS